ncbi:MAG: S8 family serine peptidase, partial [candidate division Zixibacteria bacterium]|nr:S8 family serine peptidase [candidate division Zixibacteria bacterium]
MKKLMFVTSVLLLVIWGSNLAYSGQLQDNLREFILENNPNGHTPVIAILADRVDAWELAQSLTNSGATLAERHYAVVTALQEKAASTQGPVISKIEELMYSGEVTDYTPLWISNEIGITATLGAIEEIAAMPEIETVIYDAEIELIEPVEQSQPGGKGDIQSVEQGLIAVNAPEAWAMGITGDGVLVSSLDTGVDGNHSALYSRWRGHDPLYDGHPEWAWHDPLTYTDFPFDDGTHGTHTMGTICGASQSTGDTVGVAFGAEWISAGVIDRGGDLPTRMLRYRTAFEWTMDPDGNPGTMWDVPAVCSNSWGHHLSGFPGDECNDYYWETLDNLEAAGVAVVFAAGNEGYDGLRIPGNRATDEYRSFAVAAVDGNQSGWPIASFSSRGPSVCTPDGQPEIKPEVSAPGVSVRSCYPGGSYSTSSGTSMACPHVAGAVALVKQANPNLTPEMIKQILMDTAYDLGSTGNDNSYGYGMIDVYEAVLVAQSMLEGWGAITGRVTDAENGDGLPATVTVTNRTPQISTTC